MNAASAARALHGDIAGRNRVLCPGPGHSRHDRSLSVTFTGDGFLVHSFAGDDFRLCRDHVKAALGIADVAPPEQPGEPPVDLSALVDERKRMARGMALWDQAEPIAGTVVEAYLAGRGLFYAGAALRFHPACPFRQERHPAMVALMTDAVTGEPRGVHRTALSPDGSDKATPGKMMLGAARGAVVRLSPDEDVTTSLGLAEGIETALAAPFRPIWVCLSAGTLAAFPVLSGIEAVTIYADHDRAGIRAANDCGQRWHAAGREVAIEMPAATGADMADLAEAA